jgi:nuclear transport factor 2 (NTF2) superfamily protein
MSPVENPRPSFPPYHAETAAQKARMASINDLPIHESQPKYLWPLGRRPDDHPTLSEPGL